MNLRIKTKLSLGVAFLFGVAVLVGLLSAFYLHQLSDDAKEILKDNYESIGYAQNMSQALEQENTSNFEENLLLQEQNVTEPGERELTAQLRRQFEDLKRDRDPAKSKIIRSTLFSIIKINMQAQVRKNTIAQNTANNALVYIGVIGSICFIITFAFIINFPGYIANPINELTEGIKEISNKNYDERLNFKSSDEFGELAEAFNSMAQKLDEYEHSSLAQILFEKKRIETIINKMNDPIIGLDEKKKILFVNSEAIKIIGRDPGELIGKYAPDVAIKNDLLRSLIKDLMEGHLFSPDSPVLKIFADGKESYFTKEILGVTSIPTGEKNAVSIGYVIILKNITAFKELDLAKTNFIATISHELKTPLASIQMCTKLLADRRVGGLNDEQQKIVGTVDDETNRLMKIIAELLDLAQVETGKLHLQYQPARPEQIVNYAVDALKFQADLKHLHLEIQCPPDLPLVRADVEKTSWVLINFLTNAIRYSSEKSTIILKATQARNKVIFSVQDFGKGIDPKHIDHVFEKFYKVSDTDPLNSGTGLGLAISKDFIQSEGGRIWVESDPGKGSLFSFELDTAE